MEDLEGEDEEYKTIDQKTQNNNEIGTVMDMQEDMDMEMGMLDDNNSISNDKTNIANSQREKLISSDQQEMKVLEDAIADFDTPQINRSPATRNSPKTIG